MRETETPSEFPRECISRMLPAASRRSIRQRNYQRITRRMERHSDRETFGNPMWDMPIQVCAREATAIHNGHYDTLEFCLETTTTDLFHQIKVAFQTPPKPVRAPVRSQTGRTSANRRTSPVSLPPSAAKLLIRNFSNDPSKRGAGNPNQLRTKSPAQVTF